jgi:D-arabinose 1-dehydrogenase-like Zn-dependent alcohol dehydrogenase
LVHERFMVRLLDAMSLDQDVTLLCAGITVSHPMKYHGLNKPRKHICLMRLGGLGHVAVKFAKAFANHRDAKRTFREIKMLRHLNHMSIIGIRDVIPAPVKPGKLF